MFSRITTQKTSLYYFIVVDGKVIDFFYILSIL